MVTLLLDLGERITQACDNGEHTREEIVRRFDGSLGVVRFLPPCPPGINLIEKKQSKIKSSLRSLEARTPAQLDETISAAFSTVTGQRRHGLACLFGLWHYSKCPNEFFVYSSLMNPVRGLAETMPLFFGN